MPRATIWGARAIAFAVFAITCLLPSEAHLSSYGLSTSRSFKGYQLSVTFPSAPKPSAGEQARAHSEQQRALDRAAALAERAFAHYVRGTHPFVAVRSVVLPEQTAAPDAKYWRTSAVTLLDGVEVVLFVQPNLPDRVRNQVPRDFLLSQLSTGGVLSTPAERTQLPRSTDPRPPEAALEQGLFSMSQLVYAVQNRDRIDAALASEGLSPASRILLQGIRATLVGQPITDALFEAALPLPPSPRAQSIQQLLDLSPRTDPAQVKKWVAHLDVYKQANYVDLPSGH